MGFGIHIAKRLGWVSAFRVSEIRSEVALALYSAAKNYDPEKGKFTTVAAYWVRKRLSETRKRRLNYVTANGEWIRHAKVCSMDAALLREREEDTQVPWDSYVDLQDRDDRDCPACGAEKGPVALLCRKCQIRKKRYGVCSHCHRPQLNHGCSKCCRSCVVKPPVKGSAYCNGCRNRKRRNGLCHCGAAFYRCRETQKAFCKKCENENV